MALNGVNLPLAITGQEAVWLKVWTDLGIPADTVRAYFIGPHICPGTVCSTWTASRARCP